MGGPGPLSLRIYVIAGEPSGDALGARLIAALRESGPVEVAGVGGEQMAGEGVASLFPLEKLAVMGIVEVLPRVPRLLRLMDRTAADIIAWRPDAVVTIDSAGFSKGIAKRLIAARFAAPRIHYVAPMVWAWRPGRARTMARLFDRLLALWPFEPPLFERVGLPTDLVGHPMIEAPKGDGGAFRARHGIGPERVPLALLPGSRRIEVGRLLPIFRDTVDRLVRMHPELRPHLVMPTVATVGEGVRAAAAEWPWPVTVTLGEDEKRDAFAASRAALGASGTVALELALAGVPQVTAYRLAPVTAAIVRRMLRINHASLVNLLSERRLVPEMLQEDCRPGRLAPVLAPLLADGPERRAQLAGYAELVDRLGRGSRPSLRAADAVRHAVAAAK